MLQPFDYDPNEKNKHKFMVQTMFAPEGPIESQENLVRIANLLLIDESSIYTAFY